MKNFTIKQIADELGAEAFGDLELEISGVNAPSRASINELALAMDPSYEESLYSSDAPRPPPRPCPRPSPRPSPPRFPRRSPRKSPRPSPRAIPSVGKHVAVSLRAY